MNKHFEELVEKYLKEALSAEEERQLATMLKVPENHLWLVAKIDEQFFDEGLQQVGDEIVQQQIFQGIQQQLNEMPAQQQQAVQETAMVVQMPWYSRKMIRWVGVAASVILVISLGIIFLTKRKTVEQPVAVQNNTAQKVDSLQFVVRHEVNTTGREKRVQLPDGSLIVLANGGEVIYREPFTTKRNITLIGKAYFKIARDTTKPFTVISGDISTTALGTEFTVTVLEKPKRVIVRLYEGKVVVKALGEANRKLKKDVYLLPGQAFVYDDKTTAGVKTFKSNSTAAPEQIMNEELARDNPSLPQNREGSYFMFNNQSLAEVFDLLTKMYHVQIDYDKKDVQRMYFTSLYNSSASLENILKEIALLNDLTVTKKGDAYIITK